MGRGVKLLLAFVLASAWAGYIHRRELAAADRSVVYADIGYYYVLYGYASPSLLQRDLLMETLRERSALKMAGVGPIPRILLPVETALARRFDVRTILLWKSILLQVVISMTLFLIGLRLSPRLDPFVLLGVSLLYLSTTDVFFGGLHRELGFLMVCLAFYAVLRRALPLLFVAVLGTYAFYAASLPFMLALTALAVFPRLRGRGKTLWAGGCLAAGVGLMAWTFLSGGAPVLAAVREAFTWKESFNAAGRGFFELYVINSNEHAAAYVYFTLLLGLISLPLLLMLVRRGALFPPSERVFAAAMLVSFGAALFVSKGFAGRQLLHSLPLLLAVFAARGVAALPASRPWKPQWVLLVGMLSMFLVVEDRAIDLHVLPRRAVRAVASLDLDALVAAHPDTGRLLSVSTRRATYGNNEHVSILCTFRIARQCRMARARHRELLRIYHTDRADAVVEFVRRSGVSHLLVEQRYFDRGCGRTPGRPAGRGHRGQDRDPHCGPGRALLTMARQKGRELDPGVYLLDRAAVLAGGRR